MKFNQSRLFTVLASLTLVLNPFNSVYSQSEGETEVIEKKEIIDDTADDLEEEMSDDAADDLEEEEIIDNASDNAADDIEEANMAEPVNQTESLLSLQGGQKLMEEAKKAISEENYDLAATKLQQARRIFNQLSNFYLQLAESFSGIDNRVSEEQREDALTTASYRDEATYQLSLVHRAQNKPELAVPLLIQIIRSQNPTSELGQKSYQQLYEIGFVENPLQTSSN